MAYEQLNSNLANDSISLFEVIVKSASEGAQIFKLIDVLHSERPEIVPKLSCAEPQDIMAFGHNKLIKLNGFILPSGFGLIGLVGLTPTVSPNSLMDPS
jgi:hypothetical protein